MVCLRELREDDAPLMWEWMHDCEIQKRFKKQMTKVSMSEIISFCKSAQMPQMIKSGTSLHYAITEENDEYLGTISLKAIDIESKNAEYAISLRKIAQGRGIGYEATKLLLKKAFRELGLHRVYLNVLADNNAAIRLYEKCGFKCEGEFREHIIKDDKYYDWRWYGILESEFESVAS